MSKTKKILFLLFVNSSFVYSEVPFPAIDSSAAEVLLVYGPPTSKEEHESRRESIWQYPGSCIKFHDGKVKDVALVCNDSSKLNIDPVSLNPVINSKKDSDKKHKADETKAVGNGLGRRDGKVSAKDMNDILQNLPAEGAKEKTADMPTGSYIPPPMGNDNIVNPSIGMNSPFSQ